ncbi:glycoside hydrolase family 95 protein [Mucilaginibacter sabulilitoris]|uniref:Glycoside hydrolase family 95 protein n=1 Tax=Mucilaginibacter sabulilitoris TaxID=1173583 RepID=A0ABZ0TH34_9SPHI|nr:glycoside hydrolase family 95 protein [Mucilaginibacter sabulilitoris]WPU92262.1 glycoside hydrolase family 95 protein [Mucilaginibacter sabulilitoris]
MITKRFTSITTVLLFASTWSFAQKQVLRLHYDKPAATWEETLPLGNGRLGMMPDGGVNDEKIVLNDITLWSGSPQDANNYDAYKSLPQIRELLLAGKNVEAQALIDKDFVCKGPGSGGRQWGCYQVLGDLDLKFDYKQADAKATNYQRELSLSNAMANCSYQVNGVTYKREYFTSFGDDVDMIRLTADKPGQLNFSINMSRPERSVTSTSGNTLQMQGRLDNGTDGNGMQYLANVRAKLTGGSISSTSNSLVVKNATEVIIYISAATDFRKPDFKQCIQRDLDAAMKRPYAQQKQQHIANFQKLFNRVDINLGVNGDNPETTDQQLLSFHKSPDTHKDMPVLFFQFGRYLSICSTRIGLLPPNLQGLWANQIHTPWNGDYHLDVNVQMNHFPVEVANLSELNLPLVELVRGLVKNGEKTAKAYYNADGWVAHVITNVWGFTEPGESASWGVTKAGSGWLCSNIWDHYAFTNDKAYLKSIYPILKGSAQFYSSILIKDPKTGWMVTAPSSSPENSFMMPDGSGRHASICMGATIDNQIMRELFTNVITASETLGIDPAFRDTLKVRLKQIPPAGVVSKDGRIQEWLEDYQETEPQHRHISHLYGIYPAAEITPEGTPELAEAAKKTLNVRGDDGPSWSIAYKQLFWARLHDGNRAYKLFTEIMKPTLRTDINYGSGGGIYANLLSAGPPFQIDGNFGTTAGIAEMLIQSHEGYINLLPAIPDCWKASGEVKGLRARGNFTVDFKWKDGKVTSYKIISTTPHSVKVKVNGAIKTVTAQKA